MKSAASRWIIIGAWILIATSPGMPQSDLPVSNSGYHETSYISTDKDIFSPGEVIYYNGYLVDQEGSPSAVRSGIYYVELIDQRGKIIDRRKTRIVNGYGQAYINLSTTLPAGPYWLRGYSKYCLMNYEAGIFSKSIYIVPENAHPILVSSPPIMQHMYFFPEGGQLIPDIPCRIIAAGVDGDKQLTPIHGILRDDQGNEIVQIVSDSLGFVDFTFTPESQRNYSAEIKLPSGEEKSFPLPRHSGPASIHLTKLKDDILLLKLAATSNNVNGGKLMIYSGHQLIMENEISSGDFSQEIDLKELPPGLLIFNFRSTDDQLISERLFFNETGLQPCYVDLYTDWEDSDSLVELILNLEAYDDEGLPSRPVYDVKIIPKNVHFGQTMNIENYLMVLKYLNPHSEIIFPALNIHASSTIDKFLITQNARPPEVSADAQPLSALEESLKLSGTVFNKNKPYQTDGFYSDLSNLRNLTIFQSDEDGTFEIANLDVIDTTDVIFFFNSGKQKNRSEKQTFKGNANFSMEFDSIHWPDKVDIHSLAPSFIPPFELNRKTI
ncbi:MAG: hypothetical protein KDC80_29260, partial [Saprospiraceae bacterium]|nr:hypothetical protein [Saprospiraceae bacterium]